MATSNNRNPLIKVIQTLRGNFPEPKTVKTKPQSEKFNISTARRNEILSKGIEFTAGDRTKGSLGFSAVESMVRSIFTKTSEKTIENKQILKLFTDIDKGCRLIVASIFSPTDLSQSTIPVVTTHPSLPAQNQATFREKATDFFQKRLNLKTMCPKWTHKALFTSGATVLAAIPVEAYNKMLDRAAASLGTESFTVQDLASLISGVSIYNFSSTVAGVESFTKEIDNPHRKFSVQKPNGMSEANFQRFVHDVIGVESLNLTDQMAVLKSGNAYAEVQKSRRSKLHSQMTSNMTAIPHVTTEHVTGNPIFMDIPAESVALFYPPSDPENPIAAIVMLDENGVPLQSSALMGTKNGMSFNGNNSGTDTSAFTDIANAYGMQSGGIATQTDQATIYDLYQTVVSSYILERAGKAGFDAVDIGTVDSVFRCMFHRFMSKKLTRLLLIPKEYFTYYAYEVDERGVGISRLEGIKMFLAMRMYVLVAHTLAAIDGATNKRNVEVTFTDDAMVSQEMVYDRIVANIIEKSGMNFNTVDLGNIQSDISRRGITFKGNNIPGFQQFDISNQADTRTNQFNFDPDLLGYYDKQINNGMRIPASALQSLDENEYARSLTTTNLFYSMDISMDQDVAVEKISEFLRIYARYSEEFRTLVSECLPNRKNKDLATDGTVGNSDYDITVDQIIDSLRIELPAVNLAPTKSQFEILESMTTSVVNMINSVLPDGIAGDDDASKAAVSALRSYLIQKNLQEIMASSGMREYHLPMQDMSSSLSDIKQLRSALASMGNGILATDALKSNPPDDSAGTDSAPTDVAGY